MQHKMMRQLGRWVLLTTLVAGVVEPALALVRVRDIARPLGERSNKLIGYGLVVGLKGTGDGGNALVTTKPLQVMLQKLGNAADVMELKDAKNVASVTVTAELGPNGVRNGDKIDIQVSSFYSAKSLEGGTLLATMLRSTNYQDSRVYAIAQGPVSIPNSVIPTVGVIQGGGDIEESYLHNYITQDQHSGRASFILVLNDEHANFQVAKTISMIINEEITAPAANQGGSVLKTEEQQSLLEARETLASVIDPKNIEIVIPPKLARNPAPFIARVLDLQVDLPDPQAAVVINEKTGTIAITGNVEIAPSIVHVNGLLIRIMDPEPKPEPGRPLLRESQWTKFDTAGSGGVKIINLIEALDKLNVPTKQKINALYELQAVGALRARIITR